MPTYAYACTACEHRFDAVQSFSDDALTECPECGGKLRKQYGSIGVTFSGSGFYRTDSRSGGDAGSGKDSGAGAAAAPSSTSEGSSTPEKSSTPAASAAAATS